MEVSVSNLLNRHSCLAWTCWMQRRCLVSVLWLGICRTCPGFTYCPNASQRNTLKNPKRTRTSFTNPLETARTRPLNANCPRVQCSVDAHSVCTQVKKDEHCSRLTSANQHHIVIATALASFHSIVVPRGLEPRTLRLLTVRSNQLSYETSGNAVRFSHPKKCPSKHKTKHADQLRTTVQPSFFGMEPKPIPNLLVPTLRSNGIPIRGLRVPNC